MTSYKLVVLLTLLLVSSTSCSRNVILLNKADLTNLPNMVVHEVIRIPQYDDYSCATTSLAMALTYYEGLNQTPIDKETAWLISRTDLAKVKAQGNDMAGLARLAEHYGYAGEYMDNLTIRKLEYALSQHVLAVLNIRVGPTASHAILTTGYNRSDEMLYIRDPSSLKTVMRYSELEARWSAHLSYPLGVAYRSAFLVYPKGKSGF